MTTDTKTYSAIPMELVPDNPMGSAKTLNALRMGQPTADLMPQLAPSVIQAYRYVDAAFIKRQPLVKLIVGDMGSGKTTLGNLFMDAARKSKSTIIRIDLPHLARPKLTHTMNSFLVHPNAYQACFDRIESLARMNDEQSAATLVEITKAFAGQRVSVLFEAVVEHIQTQVREGHSIHPLLASQTCEAMGTWLAGNRIQQMKNLITRLSGRPTSVGYAVASDVGGIFSGHLQFCKLCNVYPIWMIDEFESVSGLVDKYRQDHLGMYRDMIDAVYRVDWGAIMLFSTQDGVKTILQYPALYDRLQGAKGFLLTSPTWETRHFRRWDADSLINAFTALYIGAAEEGDYIAGLVVRHLSELEGELFKDFAKEIGGAVDVVARLRLKEIVFAIDHLATGVEDFRRAMGGADEVEESTPVTPADLDAEVRTAMSATTDNTYFEAATSDTLEDYSVGAHGPCAAAVMPPLPQPPPFYAEREVAPPSLIGEAASLNRTSVPTQKLSTRSVLQAPAVLTSANGQDQADLPILHYLGRITGMTNQTLHDQLRTKVSRSPHVFAAYLSAFRDTGGSTLGKWYLNDSKRYSLVHESNEVLTELKKILLERLPNRLFEWEKDRSNALTPNHPDDMPLDCLADDPLNNVAVRITRRDPNPEYEIALKKEIELFARHAELKADVEAGVLTPLQAQAEWVEPARKPPKLIEVQAAYIINPFESIGDLRHFIYTVMASVQLIPFDEVVDELVLEIAHTLFGYKPTPSRHGIQFSGGKRGINRLWARDTFYADELLVQSLEDAP